MAEDWDLYAVVRSCKSTTTTSSWAVSDSASVTTTMMDSMQGSGQTTSSSSVDTLSCLASLTFEEEKDPFSFPNLVAEQPEPRTTNTFEELQQFYKPFFSNNNNNNNYNPTTITGTTTNFAQGIIPNSPISDFGGSSGQQHQLLHYQERHQQHHHQQQQKNHHFGTSNDVVVGPRFMPRQPYISGYGGLHRGRRQYQLHELDRNHHQVPVLLPRTPDRHHHHHQVNNKTTITTPTVTLPLAPFQLPTIPMSSMPRSRKRKNQQKKTVCHVTADNLSTDVWAWRKYGQKPIKGSPFPRNYYRCSSSKGCAARKQVERNNNDPESFIITYTGDHTHPRPTHRNSLAGSTRNKLSPPPNVTPIITKNSDQSPSTTTPKLSPAPQTEQDPAAKTLVILPEERESDDQKQSDVISMEEEELMMDIDALNEDHEDEDEGVLIPNMSLADDDFFLGLKEFGCTTPGAAC